MTLPLADTGLYRGRSKRKLYVTTAVVRSCGYDWPIGFETDLVSAPDWMPGWLRKVMQFDRAARAAIGHDGLMNLMRQISRWKANRLFRKQMAKDGVWFPQRWIMWCWVSRPGAPRVNWPQPNLQGTPRPVGSQDFVTADGGVA